MNTLGALTAGFTVEQILNYLSSTFPDLGPRIKQALNAGKSPQEVLDYLNKFDTKALKKLRSKAPVVKPFEKVTYNNPHLQERESIKQYNPIPESVEKLGKAGLATAGSALGAYALGRVLPQAAQAILPTIKDKLGNVLPQAKQVPTNPIESQEPVSQEIPVNQTPISLPENLKIKIDELLASGNGPDQIEAYFLKFNPREVKEFEKQGIKFKDIIANYVQEKKNTPQKPQNLESSSQKLDVPQKIEGAEKLKKSVILPDGRLGEVESEKSGIAKINVDGQVKHRKLDEVIQSPVPIEELGEIYEQLIQKIPEKERSAMINIAGYDPHHNELIFMPHTGALYVYKDIPEEFASKIKDAMFQAKTTGQNFYGAWSAGESSRGAGLSALIKELQNLYGGKGKEYVRKYEKIYDILALPKQAVQEKQNREKEERKRRKEQERKRKKPRLG